MNLFPGTSNFVHGAPLPKQGKDLPAWVVWLAIIVCENLILTRVIVPERQASRGRRTVGEDGRRYSEQGIECRCREPMA